MIDYFYPPKPMRIWPESTLFQQLDNNPNWIGQIKYDGWRVLIFKENDQIQIWNRHEAQIDICVNPFISYFEHVPNNTVLDGELVHFRTKNLKNVIVLFDVPFWDGLDLRQLPLKEREQYLKIFKNAPEVLTEPGVFRILSIEGSIISKYNEVIKLNRDYEEGIVLKHLESKYESHISRCLEISHWLKVKKVRDERKISQ